MQGIEESTLNLIMIRNSRKSVTAKLKPPPKSAAS